MLLIRVEKVVTRTQEKKDRSKTFTLQEAWVDLPSGERRRIEVFVGKDGPYQPGAYTLAATSFEIGDFGRLSVRFANLETIREALASVSPKQAAQG